MAVSTTVFAVSEAEAQSCFPDFRPSLGSPVTEQSTNPFTGEQRGVVRWDPGLHTEPGSLSKTHGRPPVPAIVPPETDYQSWLESSAAPLTKTFPHIAWKNIELIELEHAIRGESGRPDCFFGCPEDEGVIMQMPRAATRELAMADAATLGEIAERWRQNSFLLSGNDEFPGILKVLHRLAKHAAEGNGFLCSHMIG